MDATIARADAETLAEVQRRSYAAASPGLRRAWPPEQALDAAALASFLSRRRYAVLATVRPDRRPHAAPVAFAVAEGAFWVATVAGLRLRNLRATPWASLVVTDGELDEGESEPGTRHVALTAEGPVRLHEGDAFAAAVAPLRERWLVRHGHEPTWAAALVELAPERVFSHAARSTSMIDREIDQSSSTRGLPRPRAGRLHAPGSRGRTGARRFDC